MKRDKLNPTQLELLNRANWIFCDSGGNNFHYSGELIGRVGKVITVLTDGSLEDEVFPDHIPIIDFLINLQKIALECKTLKNLDPLLSSFKNEIDCLKAYRLVSKAHCEICGIAKSYESGALSILWQLQELFNIPLPQEKVVKKGEVDE